MWRYRVVVSEVLQTLILNELHATHLSMAKMKSVACSYALWPCIDSEFERLQTVALLVFWTDPVQQKQNYISGIFLTYHGSSYISIILVRSRVK